MSQKARLMSSEHSGVKGMQTAKDRRHKGVENVSEAHRYILPGETYSNRDKKFIVRSLAPRHNTMVLNFWSFFIHKEYSQQKEYLALLKPRCQLTTFISAYRFYKISPHNRQDSSYDLHASCGICFSCSTFPTSQQRTHHQTPWEPSSPVA